MLNLNKKLNELEKSRVRTKQKRKFPIKIFGIVFLILLVLAAAIILPLRQIYQESKVATVHAKALSEGYKNQNLDTMRSEVDKLRSSVKSMGMWSNFLVWTSIIPIAGGYYQDARGFLKAGDEELAAVKTILDSLDPYKNELGFNGQPQAGSNKIAQGVKILEKTLPQLDKIQNNLSSASNAVKNIDTNKYPTNVKGKNLRQLLTSGKELIIGADIAVRDAKPALEIAPNALGVNGAKSYLLLFQNDKEIRSTGGFLTAYATLKIENGKVSSTTSDDIYRLDEKLLEVCKTKICPLTPPAQIAKYLPEVSGKPRTAWSMRDSNTSPDVSTSAKEFERMYQMLGDGLPFDGIIFIDSQVVEGLIEVTGPIEVFGTPYSAKIDHRCNCPNVIYELEAYAEIAAKGEADRKAVLGVLMQQILAKVVGASTEQLPLFVQEMIKLSNQKHVMFYMHDQKTQQALAQLNWTGAIKDYPGDYLHINDNNYAGGKSNLYVDQTVTQEISKENGAIKKKLTVEYKNPQPFNIWLNGINRDYVRIYVPKGAKLLSSKGSEDPVKTSEDLGKTVFEAFVVTRPQNSRKLELVYTIHYNPSGDYQMLIQKQPGAKDEFHYIIKYGNATKQDFHLDLDKEIKFGI
jgi:hypothetical protein